MKNPSSADESDPSRRKFIHNVTLGAAYLGTGAASQFAEEIAARTSKKIVLARFTERVDEEVIDPSARDV